MNESSRNETGAALSQCARYRYLLYRMWGNPESKPLAGFVMLNPSTADAKEDDPTIRRCVRFARDWGCSGIVVANLYAFRAKNPADLRKAEDPVGPDNAEALVALALECSPVVCAWGTNVARMKDRRDLAVYDLLADYASPFSVMCLGKTKAGHPRHPLYLPASTPLVPYFGPEETS